MTPTTDDTILVPDDTVWRIVHADRLAFLVDAECTFSAIRDAMTRAHRSILVLAWDIDSAVRLVRPGGDDERPSELAALLSWVLSRRPDLHVHVLCWDYSLIYTLERELLPRFRMGWATHPRLHFELDDRHPAGASHHEKVVVVDDRVAFVGGTDLGRRRWDTPEHRPKDPRRVTPADRAYPPHHDLHAVADGEVARALGDLARERWRRATGETLDPPDVASDPWPGEIEADLHDLDVGVVRTRPELDGRPAVHETERFHRQAIAISTRLVFAENQYLTAGEIGRALTTRISADDGPEIVVVTAKENAGWLEQATMGSLRARLCRELAEADPGGRFRVYFPVIDDDTAPNVHSKLLIVDDRVLYIGSANLSTRSMRLDTECGLAIDAGERGDLRRGLRDLRHRLLAEHLDVEASDIADREPSRGHVGTIESLRGDGRTLVPLDPDGVEIADGVEPIARLADPPTALSPARILDAILPEGLGGG
jgi:phosphatidylserine/phosphatidylglycerophosphate/cardiolipin synthase-like enzyme